MRLFGILDSTEDAVEREIIGNAGQLATYDVKNEDELPDSIADLDAAMVWHYIDISEKTLSRLTKCKVLVRVGVGFDSVDCQYAGSIGLPVVNIPDYGTNDVADHAISLLLSVCRRIPVYNELLQHNASENWNPYIAGENIYRLTGKTLGIVGMGRIGTATAVRAKAFGLNIAFYDPYLPDGYDKAYQAQRVSTLCDLFAMCDYISVHAPATAETKGMIDEQVIRSSKKGLTLINTARGGIVSLDAVCIGLREGLLGNFAADVLECEPPNAGHRLIQAYTNREDWLDGRVVITPHCAFYTAESEREMRVKSAEQMLNAVRGIPLRNCVNIEFLKNSRAVISDNLRFTGNKKS